MRGRRERECSRVGNHSSEAQAGFEFVFFVDSWLVVPGVLLDGGFADSTQ